MSSNTNTDKDNLCVTKDCLNPYKQIEKNDFAEFIRQQRKKYNDEFGDDLTTPKLGERIGIASEMFRKILNQEKPTKKRDCIIAICVVLNMNTEDIDKALNLYQHMPPLNPSNPREQIIIEMVDKDRTVSIKAINHRLKYYNFEELDVQNKRDGKMKKAMLAALDSDYEILEMKVRTPIDIDMFYGDNYNSLCTTYDPSRCAVSGYIYLANKKDKSIVILEVSSTGLRSSRLLKKDAVRAHKTKTKKTVKDDSLKLYDSIEETGEFKNFFIELENSIGIERHKNLCTLNDTKSYYSRTSARLIDDRISVFTEQFNYVIPELNEYFILSRQSGKYALYVYNQSAFMAWYLSEMDYKRFYGTSMPTSKETYESIEQLEKLLESEKAKEPKTSGEKFVVAQACVRYQMRIKAFKALMTKVDTLYQKIKDRSEFIRNLKEIYHIPEETLKYFEIEDDFNCEYDEEYGDIIKSLDSKDYELPGGTTINIALNDIYRAFELGFSDIKEICRIKAKYGSIEGVLE